MKKHIFGLAGIVVFALLLSTLFLVKKESVSRENLPQAEKQKQNFTPKEFYEIERAEKAKKRRMGYAKSDSPDEFFFFQQEIRTREGAATSDYTVGYRQRELKSAIERKSKNQQQNARAGSLDWKERGPSNVPGRTRTILALPSDATNNTWLAGAVGGGIWKTTDAGESWINKTPDLPNLAVVSLAHSASNEQIIYAGTGEAFSFSGGYINGDGIFKSLDSGETWSQLAATASNADFSNINRIIVDPDNSNIVIACANTGLFTEDVDVRNGILKSTNGGVSWTKVFTATDQVQQIVATPGDFNVQYASVRGVGVYKSTDAGQSWLYSSVGFEITGRLELAVSPTKPDRIFASTQGSISSAGSDLYISDDAGANWSIVLEEAGGTNFDFLGGQGWYDNTIAVDPYNEDIVYYGGVNLWKTEMKAGETPGKLTSVNVVEDNTKTFFDVVDFGGKYFRGGLNIGNASDNEFVSVEIRFGPGKSQKAHRFTIPAGQGAGVPATSYTYKDYVDVPFEVWDIDNNRQLMVSFRDQQDDGIFQLFEANTTTGDEENHSREYLFISAVDYDAANPSADIAKQGGHEFKQLYFFWPVLTQGGVWNPPTLPESKIIVNHKFVDVVKRFAHTENLIDVYNNFGGKNKYSAPQGQTQQQGVHPDQHNLTIVPISADDKTFKILLGNDGGVFESNISTTPGVNNGDWKFAGMGYNTSQFYGADKKRDADEYFGGMQDNGTWRSQSGETASASSQYVGQIGGDGFQVLWNYGNPDWLIGGSQNNGFRNSKDGGKTWRIARTGLSGNAPFISKLANSSSNPDVIFAVTDKGVFKSENFGDSWVEKSIGANWGSASSALTVKVSVSDFNTVWAGSGMTTQRKIHVSTDGGETFSETNNFTDVLLGSITGMATHPTEKNTAYMLYSFAKTPKILKTTDLGQTWSDISGFGTNSTSSNGFPDVAVYCLLVMPHDTNKIWVGTEIGIVESTDGGNSWALADNGLPAVAVWDMKIVDNQVVVATHGRGIWSVEIPEIPEIAVVPSLNALGTNIEGKLAISASLRSSYDSTIVLINGNPVGKLQATTFSDVIIEVSGLPVNDSLGVILHSYKNEKLFPSNTMAAKLFEVNPIKDEYSNDFNIIPNDFVGNGFVITSFSGFDNFAIHSKHNYEEGLGFPNSIVNFVYQLRTPIIIKSSNAIINYDDIAIVESGNPGTSFGDVEFWDYVIIEGTKDGINWKPLIDGYDALSNQKWLDAYKAKSKGDKSMYVNHTIDILNTFNPSDTVFFRFRLFSDPLTAGWGWSVDNLVIQGKILGVDDIADDVDYSLSVYPNPSDSKITISYNLATSSEFVEIQIVDISGKIVDSINLGIRPRGQQKLELSTSQYKPGTYVVRLKTNEGYLHYRLVII